jgi:hypothetical protein
MDATLPVKTGASRYQIKESAFGLPAIENSLAKLL